MLLQVPVLILEIPGSDYLQSFLTHSGVIRIRQTKNLQAAAGYFQVLPSLHLSLKTSPDVSDSPSVIRPEYYKVEMGSDRLCGSSAAKHISSL
jgi:hypothetical protein